MTDVNSSSSSSGTDSTSGVLSSKSENHHAAFSSSDTEMESQVVSRLHLTDEKRQMKNKFDEKVRAEAQKKARLEKVQQRRVGTPNVNKV